MDRHAHPAMTVPLVDLRAQYQVIAAEVRAAIEPVLAGAAYVLGPAVDAFEEAFARFCGARHCVGVANGTDALVLALAAAGVGLGDEVITAANTFVATAEAIAHVGARPVFVDIDPQTYTLDPTQLEHRITPRTRAIIPVHLYGHPAAMDPILAVARAHGCRVIEDAAQAHGAADRGRRVGTLGDAACFSFYPSKNLGAFGDAGAVVTNDDGIGDRVRALRDHGSHRRYEHAAVGYNSRLDSLQAAVLTVKLAHLEEWNRRRVRHAQRYGELLAGVPGVATPSVRAGCTHVFHLYVIRVAAGREELRRYLQERGIDTGVHYPTPVHLTPAFHAPGGTAGACPVAERYAQQILSLPMFPELTQEQIAYVTTTLGEFVAAPRGVGEGRR